MTNRLRALLLALLAVLLLAPAAAAEPLALVDDAETLGPGIRLDHDVVLEPTGFVDRHVVTVDLTRPAVTSDLLSAPSVAQGTALTQQANAAGAVAGINGDFFDINNSQAALGFEIQGGLLRKSGDRNAGQSFGVTDSGLGQLVNLALTATATWDGTARPLSGLNESGIPAGGIGSYTSAWGAYNRALLTGTATDTAEVWVADGRVVRAAQPPEGGTLPAGTTALVGREAGAAALRTLAVGRPVALAYALSPEAADRLRFAVGTDVVLVRDGVRRPDSETSQGAAGGSPAPRTAIGFKDGGRTLLLVTVDGPGGTGVGGVTLPKLATIMHGLGAETAVNLDGGGSTTMVARTLGEPLANLRNVPSDGHERADPNGVGIFVAPGNGRPEDVIVSPDGDEARVFPGLHRRFTARAVDDHLTPVPVDERDVRWDADGARIDDHGVLRAPSRRERSLEVEARIGRAEDEERVRVLGPLHRLELSSRRLAFPDTARPTVVAVTGRDAEGYAAPVDALDLDLDYDESVVRIEPAASGLQITPLRTGATLIELRAAGERATLPVTVGVETRELYRFDHPDEIQRWITNGTAGFAKTLSADPDGLKLTYAAQRNMGITKTPADSRIPAPGQPLRIRVHLTASVATQFANLAWYDADGVRKGLLIGGPRPGRNALEWTLPSDTKFPIRVAEVQVIETRTAQQAPGEVVFHSIEADLAPELALPPLEPLRRDPLISADGRLGERDDWTFATLSDVQFTAAQPELTKVAIAALVRIRRTDPDLVVLNGDIVDTGSAADVALARDTLEAGGCDLIAPGAQPDADPGTVPCYYVPGNHESYRADGSQGTLAAWVTEFGAPHRTFDHAGTRFILLNSALGSLRLSGFDQLPMLEQALDDARRDRDVRNVVVFAHHAVDDPDEKKASQLGDRREVALIKQLLSGFRGATGKGVAMIGSHAQIVDTRREEGVPYQVLPSSGKSPYGTPDRGGFTGWVRWGVDRHAEADEQWLTADVRAFAQEVTLDAPETVRTGETVRLTGSIVQPSGVQPGTRVVPLAYPMSVHWSGSDCLDIGNDRRHGRDVARLDPRTGELTGLRPGTVEVRVTNDSMREYTGTESLAPVTATRTVEVTRKSRSGHGRATGGHC